jgi:hypothetical protein
VPGEYAKTVVATLHYKTSPEQTPSPVLQLEDLIAVWALKELKKENNKNIGSLFI